MYAIGALICVLSTGFPMLLLGVVVAGVASGTDLPVSLAVISRDAPNQEMASQMVASTQIFWQVGQFVSTGAAFIVSTMAITGGRIVFALFVVLAVILWIWRTLSMNMRRLHKAAAERIANRDGLVKATGKRMSVMDVLFHSANRKMYMRLFMAILIYYVFWNFIANTWGQFTTFVLVKAGASQTLSTGIGLGLHIAALFESVKYLV